jgi:phage replication O-like protein O
MANQDIEKDYTKMPNKLLDVLIGTRMRGESVQVLSLIIRKTCGWHKREDAISLSQFVKATGIKKQNVSRALRYLVERNIIIKIDNGRISKYEINRNLRDPKPLSETITDVIEDDKASLSRKRHTKESTTKETITKEHSPGVERESRGHRYEKLGKNTLSDKEREEIKRELRSAHEHLTRFEGTPERKMTDTRRERCSYYRKEIERLENIIQGK